jgi:hypothetical protein
MARTKQPARNNNLTSRIGVDLPGHYASRRCVDVSRCRGESAGRV